MRASLVIECPANAAAMALETASALGLSQTQSTLEPLPLSHPVQAPALTPSLIASPAPGILGRR
jgi:hypothetical protein